MQPEIWLDTTKPSLYPQVEEEAKYKKAVNTLEQLCSQPSMEAHFSGGIRAGEQRRSLPSYRALICREQSVDISNHFLFVST